VRNNFIYTTASTNISNLIPLFYTFNFIYIRNLFNFNFILLNYLIKNFLILIALITSIFAFRVILLFCNWLITFCNYFIITTYNYKLLFAMLVSLYLNIIAINNNTTALSSILLNVFIIIK